VKNIFLFFWKILGLCCDGESFRQILQGKTWNFRSYGWKKLTVVSVALSCPAAVNVNRKQCPFRSLLHGVALSELDNFSKIAKNKTK
jgi:hypothetical protein